MKRKILLIFVLFVSIIFITLKSSPAVYSYGYSSDKQTQESSVDFGPYMRELQRSIKYNWTPPKGTKNQKAVLLFKIDKNGNLINCEVKESSGIKEFDDAAINAVNLTAPFRKLPDSFKGNHVDILFNFDYRVFNSIEPKKKSNPTEVTQQNSTDTNENDFQTTKTNNFNVDYDLIRNIFVVLALICITVILSRYDIMRPKDTKTVRIDYPDDYNNPESENISDYKYPDEPSELSGNIERNPERKLDC